MVMSKPNHRERTREDVMDAGMLGVLDAWTFTGSRMRDAGMLDVLDAGMLDVLDAGIMVVLDAGMLGVLNAWKCTGS